MGEALYRVELERDIDLEFSEFLFLTCNCMEIRKLLIQCFCRLVLVMELLVIIRLGLLCLTGEFRFGRLGGVFRSLIEN